MKVSRLTFLMFKLLTGFADPQKFKFLFEIYLPFQPFFLLQSVFKLAEILAWLKLVSSRNFIISSVHILIKRCAVPPQFITWTVYTHLLLLFYQRFGGASTSKSISPLKSTKSATSFILVSCLCFFSSLDLLSTYFT